MTFCELPLWEICIPRIVQAVESLIGCVVECQSIKKVGGRRSEEELYQARQALFFVSPFPLNVSPSETKIEPDRRFAIFQLANSDVTSVISDNLPTTFPTALR